MGSVGRIRPYTGDDLLGRKRFQWTTGLTLHSRTLRTNADFCTTAFFSTNASCNCLTTDSHDECLFGMNYMSFYNLLRAGNRTLHWTFRLFYCALASRCPTVNYFALLIPWQRPVVTGTSLMKSRLAMDHSGFQASCHYMIIRRGDKYSFTVSRCATRKWTIVRCAVTWMRFRCAKLRCRRAVWCVSRKHFAIEIIYTKAGRYISLHARKLCMAFE
jgi:hypothetical protein